jgi:hypothetical protein
MPRSKAILAVLCLAVLLPASVDAQVTLDVSKITCDQFTGFKVTSPRNLALWLSGFYNGKKDNTVIEPQKLAANSTKLTQYCLANPNVMLMQAVEKIIGGTK